MCILIQVSSYWIWDLERNHCTSCTSHYIYVCFVAQQYKYSYVCYLTYDAQFLYDITAASDFKQKYNRTEHISISFVLVA